MYKNYIPLPSDDEEKKEDATTASTKLSASTKLIREIFQKKQTQLTRDMEATQQFSLAVVKKNKKNFWYPFIGLSLFSAGLLVSGIYFISTANTEKQDEASNQHKLLLKKYLSDNQSSGHTCEDDLEIYFYPDGPHSRYANACRAKDSVDDNGFTILKACNDLLNKMCSLEDDINDDPKILPGFGIAFCCIGLFTIAFLIYKYLKRNSAITLDGVNTEELSEQLNVPITNQSYRNLSNLLFNKRQELTEQQEFFYEAREMVSFFNNYAKDLEYFDENVLSIMVNYLVGDKKDFDNTKIETRIEIIEDEPAAANRLS